MFNSVLSCSDAASVIWGLFDFSIAPSLLFYAYSPVIAVSLFLSCFVLIKENKSLRSSLLFSLAVVFTLLLVNEIITWIAAPVSMVQFTWQLVPILRILVAILTVYFVHVFTNGKDISFFKKIILSLPFAVVVILSSTKLNIAFFDITNCEGVPGWLWDLTHLFEFISILWIIVVTFNESRKASISKDERTRAVFLGVGAVLFLSVFFGSNILGDVTKVYHVDLIGPAGMAIFMAFLTYITVRYKAFNIKLLGAQALTVTLWVLVGALFFLSQNMTNRIVTGVTFLLAVVFGVKLMQSVKREVEQRERIEKLAEDLSVANEGLSVANEKLKGLDKLKSEFLSLASHQLRSPLTAIKGYTSMLLEGTFGKLQEQQREINVRILESSQSLINMIEDFLNVSKIEQGGMQYAFEQTNLSKMVSTLFAEMKISAENKHLEFTLEMEEGSTFMANVDAGKLKQVFMNLIDNSIKYTPSGFVHVSLVRDKNKNTITFAVKDSGVGVSLETKDKLFQKFSRGEGGKLNTGGSGLGLYLAQEITKAHKGEIVIESEGLGKGSTFKVTLSA